MQTPGTEVIVRGLDNAELLRCTLSPGEYVIGRNPDCSLRVETDLISRQHARLTITADYAMIEDLGSSNGTFINGQAASGPTRLWPGQRIQLGSATVELNRARTLSGNGEPPSIQAAAVRQFLPEEFLREKKYDIGAVVAQGGMGAILDAHEATIDRKVAMKVMLDGAEADDLARFVTEAKITAQLEHPNIVPVHELGVDENEQIFYTMKFVRGITLKKVFDLLTQGLPGTIKKYPLGALLTVFQKLCDAVAFAHSKRVIHRDLKPENVMIGDFGEVLVMDWGLAKIIGQNDPQHATVGPMRSLVMLGGSSDSAVGSTMAGAILGTPQYMAPEQARGEVESLSVPTDIYALGAILYHLLALRPAVLGDDAYAVVARVGRGEIDPLPRGGPKYPHLPDGRIPESLAAVVRKAMAFDPSQRYGSVLDLQRDVEAFQNGFATSAENAGVAKQLTLLLKRNKGATAAAAAVLLLLAASGVYFVSSQRAMSASLARLKSTAPTFLAQAQALVEKAPTQEGALEKALEQIDHAIDIAPEEAEAYAAKGRVLQTLQRIPEARAAFAQALKRDPDNNSAHVNLSVCEVILREQGANSQLTPSSLRRLQTALQQQWRGAEGVVLGRALGKGKEQAIATVTAALKAANIDRPVEMDSDGGIGVSLDGRMIKEIGFLRGLPLDRLQISRTQVRDLSPLEGMRLRKLECGDLHELTDLSPLRGMPLVELSISNTPVKDLSPLRGLPLERLGISGVHPSDWSVLGSLRSLKNLDLSGTGMSNLNVLRGLKLQSFNSNYPIPDVSPLADMPLENLSMQGNGALTSLEPFARMPLKIVSLRNCTRVADLSPLRNSKIENFDLARTNVTDLKPLASNPLRGLNLSGTPLADVSPIHEMKSLRRLHLSATEIHDLSPLKGSPIEVLSLDRCFGVHDFAPLKEMPRLIAVALPYRNNSIGALRSHPTLRFVGLNRSLENDSDIGAAIKRGATAEPLRLLENLGKALSQAAGGPIHPREVRDFGEIFRGAVHVGSKWYFLHAGSTSWTHARDEAKALGGHLAAITSREEEDAILANLGQPIGMSGAWLGAHLDESGKAWQWVTGEPWEFSNWLKGEPSHGSNPVENALMIMRRNPGEFGWNDVNENNWGCNGFIIEWED